MYALPNVTSTRRSTRTTRPTLGTLIAGAGSSLGVAAPANDDSDTGSAGDCGVVPAARMGDGSAAGDARARDAFRRMRRGRDAFPGTAW